MCFSGADIPDAPPPPPPPAPDATFQAGSELDTESLNAGSATKKGKDSLKTVRVDSGLGIPTGA
jgi:hypothetical protein